MSENNLSKNSFGVVYLWYLKIKLKMNFKIIALACMYYSIMHVMNIVNSYLCTMQ